MERSTQTLGLIGGMSWHSTVDYYRLINSAVAEALGGHHSADIVMASLDFDRVRACQVAEDWAGADLLLADAARRLEGAGAGSVLICTNLMHKCAPAVEAAVGVPLLHIGDAVARAARARGASTLGVVGARWTMEDTFYADRLARHDITTLVPSPADREMVDRVIFDELTRGTVREESRAAYAATFADLASRGAEAIVLACTEIQMLTSDADSPVPLIDSMAAHASYAAEHALGRLSPV